MRVLGACSLGGAGHLGPLSSPLRAAQRRGDEVRVIGPPSMGDMVRSAGFEFVAGGEPDESVIAPIREQLPVVSAEAASVLGNRELFGRLATAAMLPTISATVQSWVPDLVVRDPCEYSSAVVAADAGVPTVQVAISLAAGEANSVAVAAPALDEFRPGLAHELMAMPYLSRFPPSLDPSPFATTIRYREDGPVETSDGADWWSGVPGARVYLSFGTVLGHMTIATDVFRAAIAAVRLLGVDGPSVLFTVGPMGDISLLGDLPPNVRVERWVPQAQAFRGADLVVCHGGSGTVLGALGAGLPLVVVPVFADQFANAAMVTASGAGREVRWDHAYGERESVALAEAIGELLADPSYRERAMGVAAEMAAMPEAGDALAAAFDAVVERLR